MKILLVDDEKLQLLRLEECVKAVLPEAEILSYLNPVQAFNDNKEVKIDIAFLDIEMPQVNGVMLAKSLKGVNPLINIVFVTAYDNYAMEAMKLHASGYISKPVSEKRIKEEIEGLRYPISLRKHKKLQVKCFGNFEIFYEDKPLKFAYSKSKELFAYLVDREGASININELNAVLWEEDHKSYLRNLISDIQKTLKAIKLDDVFIRGHNSYSIDPSKIDCDAYEFKNNNPDAIRLYRGEYMIQYPWAMFTLE